MKNIHIIVKNYTSTIIDLNLIDIYKYNFYNILGSIYQKLQKKKSEFYYETDINYHKKDMNRLAIFKTNNENCIIRFYKTHTFNRKDMSIILDIEIVDINQLQIFILDILQGNSSELSIGTQKISINIEPSLYDRPILER